MTSGLSKEIPNQGIGFGAYRVSKSCKAQMMEYNSILALRSCLFSSFLSRTAPGERYDLIASV